MSKRAPQNVEDLRRADTKILLQVRAESVETIDDYCERYNAYLLREGRPGVKMNRSRIIRMAIREFIERHKLAEEFRS